MTRYHHALATLLLLTACLVCHGQTTATGTAEVDLQPALDPILQRIADAEARIKALEEAGGQDHTDDQGGADTTPELPPVTTDKATDLWLNVFHYENTPVIAPGSAPHTYIITDPRFTTLMSKWSGIRYLDWTGQLRKGINWTWDDRVNDDLYQDAPSDADHRQADGRYRWHDLQEKWNKTGVPLEAIIAVANATHTHVWWCAPQQADLDYMRRAGALFAATLDQDLHFVIELGNEVWQSNRGWLYDEQSDGDFGIRMRLYAEDSAAKFKAFVEGGFPQDRLTRVIGGQLHNIGVLSVNALKWIDDADYDAISCAGYFGNSPTTYITGDGGLNATLKGLKLHADLAKAHHKRLLIYELNQHIDDGTSNTDFVDSDPVIDGVAAVLERARELDIKTIAVYAGVGKRSARYPFPVYTEGYNARRIVKRLDWPEIE